MDKSIINKEELYPLERLRAILCEDHDWQGNVREYADKQGIGLDRTALQELLGEFFLYLQTCGTLSKTVPDTQRHFVNWLVKKRNVKERKNKQLPAKQTGVMLKDNSPDKFKDITGW